MNKGRVVYFVVNEKLKSNVSGKIKKMKKVWLIFIIGGVKLNLAQLKPALSPVLVLFGHFWSSFDQISNIFGLDWLKNSESDYLILKWPVVAFENDNDLPWRLGLSLGPIRVRVKIKSKRFLSVNESEIRMHPNGGDFSNEVLELALWWVSNLIPEEIKSSNLE